MVASATPGRRQCGEDPEEEKSTLRRLRMGAVAGQGHETPHSKGSLRVLHPVSGRLAQHLGCPGQHHGCAGLRVQLFLCSSQALLVLRPH